jgi:hypothetical protein
MIKRGTTNFIHNSIYFTMQLSALYFNRVLWLVTVNCRQKQISIFFIMMAFLFSPLQENVINFWHSTKHSPYFPILSFHISIYFEIIVNNTKLCETPWEPCLGTVWNTLGTPRPKKFSNPLVNLYPPEQQSNKLFSLIQKRPLHHRLLEDFFWAEDWERFNKAFWDWVYNCWIKQPSPWLEFMQNKIRNVRLD